jgi:probable F420-dependent oxidoreductase
MTVRPFRFGLSVRGAENAAGWRDKARRAEALGFSTLLVADHLAEMFPPLSPLVAAADATESLRVGTFVLNNDFRHPALLAREAAAIDLLTDGRLELGLGAGHMASEYREAGLQFDAASTRIERLAESVHILKGLLAGEAVTFEGAHYQVRGHRIYPAPVQKPRPPLLIGGNGRRLLTLAGQEADIVGLTGASLRRDGTQVDPSGFTASATAERIELVRQAAGDRFAALELNALVQRAAEAPAAAETAARFADSLGISEAEVRESPYLLLGSPEAMVEALQKHRELLGISYYVVFEHSMDAVTPVVSRLAGC